MAVNYLECELVSYLTAAHAMEQQGLQLLAQGAEVAGDARIAAIYRSHRRQTEEHVSLIAHRLETHSECRDLERSGGGSGVLGTDFAGGGSPPHTLTALTIAAYAFENVEIAAYHLLRGVAVRADDHETVAVVDRILEQEEAAAEQVASTFDRVLDVALPDRE